MNRTVLKLGDLKKGNTFYFFGDAKKITYKCLGEGDPIQTFSGTKQTMKYKAADWKQGYESANVLSKVVRVEL